ncbi:hypothetical protein ACFQGT_19605 [Natrialbaceae archaeon GCM10025810]|uniref:hypothetical protein n=1 Tax=Halovalidus salilacus TaxID=3075124 RepID=UPI00360EF64F
MSALTRFAIGCLLVGAMLLAGPAFGFSTIAADRGISVEAVENENALLGLVETDSPDIEQHETETEIVTLENNFGSTITALDVTVDIDTDDLSWQGDSFPSELSEDESASIIVECTKESRNAYGTALVDVTVDRAVADNNIIVEGPTVSDIQVQYDCRPGGGNNKEGEGFNTVFASNVSDGGTQTFTFETNGREKDGVRIDLSDTGDSVRYPQDDDAVSIVEGSHKNDEAYFEDENTLVFHPKSNLESGEQISIQVADVSVSGTSGETFDATFERIETNDRDSDRFQID